MKRTLLSGFLLFSGIALTTNAQTTTTTTPTVPATGVQKAADKINNSAFQAQSAVNGANNTVNAMKSGVETLKSVGSIFGKGKKKKSQDTAVSQTGTEAQVAAVNNLGPTTTPNANATTIIFFDKIEYMMMKQMKDSLSANKAVVDVKNSFNKEGKYFIEIQHSLDSDALLTIILDKWGKNYDVESAEAEKIVLKSK